jgi:hypothetical protein
MRRYLLAGSDNSSDDMALSTRLELYNYFSLDAQIANLCLIDCCDT